MNAREALDYLHRVTVVEPTVANEQAEVAINTLRLFFDALERLSVVDRGQDERLLAEEMRQTPLDNRRGR